MWRITYLGGAVLAAAAIAAFPVAASADWGPARTVAVVPAPADDADPRLLANPRGDRSLLWTSEEPVPQGGIQLATWEAWWPRDGDLQAPRRIGTSAAAVPPRGFLGPEGTTVVAWGLRAAVRPPAGGFGEPRPVATGDSDFVTPLVDARGAVHVLWQSQPDRTLYVSTQPPGGDFGAPQRLSPPHVRTVEAGVDADGDLLVAWARVDPPAQDSCRERGQVYLELVERDAGGSVGPTRRLATGSVRPDVPDCDPIVAVRLEELVSDDAGRALVLWRERRGFRYVTVDARGESGTRRTLFQWPRGGGAALLMAGAPSGRVVAVVNRRVHSGSTTTGFGRSAQALAHPPRAPGASPSGVAVNSRGGAVVVMSRGARVFAATRPPGGRFGAAQLLGSDLAGPRLALDDAGRATVASLEDGDAFARKRIRVLTDEPRYVRAPAVGLTVATPAWNGRGRSLRAALRDGIGVRLYLSKAARYAVTLHVRGARAPAARAGGRFAEAGMRELRFRLSPAARRRLRAAGRGTVVLAVRAVDSGGRRGRLRVGAHLR